VATFIALYDACVLYPAPLRDLLIRLAGAGLCRAKWTDRIHEEWIRNVLRDRPELSRERLERTRRLMNEHIADCLVTDYEDLIETIGLPDEDDRHVVAAAIRGGAHVIVTSNLKHFPTGVLSRYSLEAQHPDVFVRHLWSVDEARVCEVVRRQRADLTKPAQSIEELLTTFEAQGLVETVARLRSSIELL